MGKIYGYVRISTEYQNMERQVRNIKDIYPDAIIIKEAFTGTRTERPVFSKLLKQVKPGDSIVFDSVSRMSRNAREGFTLYEALFIQGIELIFLKESYINTSTYKEAFKQDIPLTGTHVDYILEGIKQYLLALAKEQIRLAFLQAEKEVMDLRQRTKEGIETAKLHGKQIGRKSGSKIATKKSLQAKAIILQHSRSFGGSLKDSEVITLAGINRCSYYKYKKELKEGLENEGNNGNNGNNGFNG